jgi:hypothetical protein
MKTKISFLIAVTAIITLSFTFISTKADKSVKTVTTVSNEAALGGLAIEDAL